LEILIWLRYQMKAFKLTEKQKQSVRELVRDLNSLEINHLTKRERARSIRANVRQFIKSLNYKPYHDCWLEGR
jgi:hypothetical protein